MVNKKLLAGIDAGTTGVTAMIADRGHGLPGVSLFLSPPWLGRAGYEGHVGSHVWGKQRGARGDGR